MERRLHRADMAGDGPDEKNGRDGIDQGMLIGMLDKRLSACYRFSHGHNLPNQSS